MTGLLLLGPAVSAQAPARAGVGTEAAAPDSVGMLTGIAAMIDSGAARDDKPMLGQALDRLAAELYRQNPPPRAWYLVGRARFALVWARWPRLDPG